MKDEDLVKKARDWFVLASEAEMELRKVGLEDLKFRMGDQWPGDVTREREIDRRPCLTINRLPQFVRQITNDQRQNRPAIKVVPANDMAAEDTAAVLQGMIRHIEQASDADVAYDTAFMSAVDNGFGYFRIVTEYADDESFDQCIAFKRVRNPFKVYFDPTVEMACYEDANWAMIVEDFTAEAYKAEFKESELTGVSDWKSIGDGANQWISEKLVRVAEIFHVDEKSVRLVKLSTGETVDKSEVEYVNDIPQLPPGAYIVDERSVKRRTVKWFKTNGYEILDKTDWLGRWIPIIPVLGDELEVDGKRVLEGIIRHVKDSQRMYNYWASAETESIALAPRAPYIGAEGQFEGLEDQWKNANTRNYAYLQYKPKSLNGEALPPPQRNQYEPAVAAITNARLQAAEDMKATTGIYDASLGARSNERSGKAILARDNQAQTATYHFIDNLARSIRHAGRILVDLIPKIYDAPRVVRIIDGEGKTTNVPLNQPFQENGVEKIYQPGVGKYDVALQAGPGYATKRQQAVESMLELTRSYPGMAAIAGDLMVKNMDWPGAQEIADRLKRALPPEFQDNPKQQNLPPQVQQQMGQMNQMIEQLTAKLNEAQDKLQDKQLEMDSKEKIAFAQMRVDLITNLAATQSKEASESYKAELSGVQQMLAQLQTDQPSPDDGAAAAALEEQFNKVMERITGMETRINVPAAAPIVNVAAPARGKIVKSGRAVPQADGSMLLEVVESPVGE